MFDGSFKTSGFDLPEGFVPTPVDTPTQGYTPPAIPPEEGTPLVVEVEPTPEIVPEPDVGEPAVAPEPEAPVRPPQP